MDELTETADTDQDCWMRRHAASFHGTAIRTAQRSIIGISPRECLRSNLVSGENDPKRWRTSLIDPPTLYPVGGSIMAEGISFSSELFIQLCQVTVRIKKLRRMHQGLFVRRNSRTFLVTIFQQHPEVEVSQGKFGFVLQGATITGFRIGQQTEIVVQQAQIDVRIRKTRV